MDPGGNRPVSSWCKQRHGLVVELAVRRCEAHVWREVCGAGVDHSVGSHIGNHRHEVVQQAWLKVIMRLLQDETESE